MLKWASRPLYAFIIVPALLKEATLRPPKAMSELSRSVRKINLRGNKMNLSEVLGVEAVQEDSLSLIKMGFHRVKGKGGGYICICVHV